MTGADVVSELLRADAEMTAFVPVDRIKQGALPDNAGLPALLIRTISSVDRQTLKRQAVVRTVDRVAVMVRAMTYRDQKLVMKLARAACAARTGDFAGASRVSVLTAGGGPDVRGAGNSYEQTIDFRVSFDAPY